VTTVLVVELTEWHLNLTVSDDQDIVEDIVLMCSLHIKVKVMGYCFCLWRVWGVLVMEGQC
jgi:hypothetical protein